MGNKNIILSIVLICSVFFYKNSLYASTRSLETELKQKKTIVERRKTLIKELTEEERKARADLRRSEQSIAELERDIAKQQNSLVRLEQKEKNIAYHLEYLGKQQQKRGKTIDTLLQTIWPLQVNRHDTTEDSTSVYDEERKYIWIQYLMRTLEEEYAKLEKEKQQTAIALEEQRNNYFEQKKVSERLQSQLQALVSVSLEYSKKIKELRTNKQSAEEELKDIVNVIISIENQLQEKRNIGKITTNSKGKLPWPVRGSIDVPYAPRSSPSVKGIGFATEKLATVTAVADGTVVHNDILRGFGRVIILSHGKSYYTVYAFLASSPRAMGETVKQGASLGTAGFYPAVNSAGLYFELRKDESTINPTTWLRK